MSVEAPEIDKSKDQEDELRELFARGTVGRAYADDADSMPAQPPAEASGTAAAASHDAGTPTVKPAAAAGASSATPAMGNAYKAPMGPPVPPELIPGRAVSPAAKSLTEFSLATGASVTPPKTHMEQVAPPPQAPTMSPDYAATQADLRAKSAVTPKYDPQTGQTLDKYKPSVGARIGRAFLDAGRGFLYGGLGGAVAAPLEGAFGNKNSPGYYGKGAVSGQYFKDEAERQREVAADTDKIKSFEAENTRARDEFSDKNKTWKDAYDTAKNQDVEDVKQQAADEKARHDQETEYLKQQLQEATTPEAKEQAILKARTTIADQIKLRGDDRTFYLANGKIPDDRFKAREIEIRERELKLREHDAARKAGEDGGQWYTSSKELSDYKSRTSSLDREASTLESRKALYTEGGTTDQASQDALKRINDRLTAIDQEKETVKQSIISNRPNKKAPASTPANQPPAAAPKLTPIPDKSVKMPSGKVYNVGDDIPGRGKIKGFGKGPDGKINAMF